MSFALTAPLFTSLVAAETATAFIQPPRAIGFIIPECVVQETHSDRLQVTQHPVELGAAISDHAFVLPFEVSIRFGFSGVAGPAARFGFGSGAGSFPGVMIGIYAALQGLMQQREPFVIITGKRLYQNMLLTDMEVTTDQHTENVLMVEAHCQQVIIVATSSVPATPAQNQQLAPKTIEQTSLGSVQLQPVSQPTVAGFGSGP